MPVLHWLDRNKTLATTPKVPCRILWVDEDLSCGDADSGNMLIQGDNLHALKALLPYFRGAVKCVFIDPPYNTKSAFEHYSDSLEHSKWLDMMVPRLELLRELLSDDGSIWVTIDDHEAHYLKVVMDEIFGRGNFVANMVWNHRKSVQNDIVISLSHNHVLVYSKNSTSVALNRLSVDEGKYENPDNDPVFITVRRTTCCTTASLKTRLQRAVMCCRPRCCAICRHTKVRKWCMRWVAA